MRSREKLEVNIETIIVRKLEEDELPLIWPFISEANPKMTRETFDARLKEMVELGYSCLAAFDGETIAGITAYWYGVQFWCGPYMELDNVRLHPDYRGKGVGGMLLGEVERIGRERGAELTWLKSYTHNTPAHKFFHRHDYWIQGFIFRKNIEQ